MIGDITKEATQRMQKSVDALKEELKRMRTGRAHPGLLESVRVEYYGTQVPIKQTANITVEDARTLVVTPWEKNIVSAVEKAIMNAGLGLNPVTAGTVIRVPLPPMTEERRKDLVKVVRHSAENGRVAIRAVRREALGDVKDLLKEKMITEDEERKAEVDTQKLTDRFIAQVDALLKEKEAEIMEV
jgi:ribosome recycling factor